MNAGLGAGLYLSNPVKPKMFVTNVYSETLTLQSSSLQTYMGTEAVYRLNSVNQPNFISAIGTGQSHQAYGHDQMTFFYNSYKVYACKVELEIGDSGGDGAYLGVIVQPPNTSTTLAGLNPHIAIEKPGCKIIPCPDSGPQDKKFTCFVRIGKIAGLTKREFEADVKDFVATTTTNPTLSPWLRVAVGDLGAPNAVTTVRVAMKLTYYTQYYDRKELASS